MFEMVPIKTTLITQAESSIPHCSNRADIDKINLSKSFKTIALQKVTISYIQVQWQLLDI